MAVEKIGRDRVFSAFLILFSLPYRLTIRTWNTNCILRLILIERCIYGENISISFQPENL